MTGWFSSYKKWAIFLRKWLVGFFKKNKIGNYLTIRTNWFSSYKIGYFQVADFFSSLKQNRFFFIGGFQGFFLDQAVSGMTWDFTLIMITTKGIPNHAPLPDGQ